MIRPYALQHGLQTRIGEKAPKKPRAERGISKDTVLPPPKPQTTSVTYQQTLELYHAGHSVEEIATMRGKSPNTIQEHLAAFVMSGEVPVRELVSDERLAQIIPVVEEKGTKMLRPIKDALPEEVTYAEIRFAIAHLERMRES